MAPIVDFYGDGAAARQRVTMPGSSNGREMSIRSRSPCLSRSASTAVKLSSSVSWVLNILSQESLGQGLVHFVIGCPDLGLCRPRVAASPAAL